MKFKRKQLPPHPVQLYLRLCSDVDSLRSHFRATVRSPMQRVLTESVGVTGTQCLVLVPLPASPVLVRWSAML